MSARWAGDGEDRRAGWRLVVALVCTGLVAVGIGLASGVFSGGAHADPPAGRIDPPRRPTPDRPAAPRRAAPSRPTPGRPASPPRAVPSGPARSPAAATAAFGLDLLGKLPPGNAVISPDSIATALAMAGTGARGETAAQIAAALHLKDPSRFDSIGGLQHDVFAAQAAAAAGHPSAPTLTIANGLFVQQGYALAPAFVGGLSDHFGAAPEAVDFAGDPPGATAAINSWTSAHTDGIIPKLFSELPAETRLVLANAVYLKAKWREAFERGAYPAPFHRNGKTTKAKFMAQTDEFDYAAGPGYQAVDLPYRGSTLSMLVVLPTEGGGVAELESRLREEGLAPVVKRLSSRPVRLSMPRFHLRTEAELNRPLKALGMKLPFSEAADFAGITTADPLKIGQVQHVADIKVDEEGTEAAAATGLVAESSVEAPPRNLVVFDADHPFLFFVRDDKTGAILFAGRMTNPQGT
jgi:serpin B